MMTINLEIPEWVVYATAIMLVINTLLHLGNVYYRYKIKRITAYQNSLLKEIIEQMKPVNEGAPNAEASQ